MPHLWMHEAHLQMGEHNIRFEDLQAAAEENGRSVAETLEVWGKTLDTDRAEHAEEYAGPE